MSDVTGASAARGEGRETLVTGSQTVAQPTGGLPAHPAPTRASDGLLWPCHIHNAHGPHNAYQDSSPSETCPVCGRERGQSHARSNCDGECPGVKAHPNTMIGRRR